MTGNYFPDMVQFVNSISVEDVLKKYGVRYSHKSGPNILYHCPWHDDVNKPNLTVNSRKNIAYCFACSMGGGPIKVAGFLEKGRSFSARGEEFKEIVVELYTYFNGVPFEKAVNSYVPERQENIPLEVTPEEIEKFQTAISPQTYKYLAHRGLYSPFMFKLGETTHFQIPYVTVPIYYGGELVAAKYRRNDLVSESGIRYYTVIGSKTYYPHMFCGEQDKRIFFTEDSFSAMSVRMLGFPAASLASGNSIRHEGYDIFRKEFSSRNLIVLPDRGDSGMNLIKSMEELHFNIEKYTVCPNNYKDFNDFYQADRSGSYQFLLNLWNR